jgi:hypothetical protein
MLSKIRCRENDEGIGQWEHEFYLLRETPKAKIYVCKFCGKTVIAGEGTEVENAQRI